MNLQRDSFCPRQQRRGDDDESSGPWGYLQTSSKKAKWAIPEKSYYKQSLDELRRLGVKTEFLIMAPDGIDRNHLFQMAEGPNLHNQDHAGKLICFSLIFAYICTFRL